jgi:hypothetical protein
MKSFTAALALLGLASTAFACGDDHGHSHDLHKRLAPQAKLTPPTRPLQWGDINVSTTSNVLWRFLASFSFAFRLLTPIVYELNQLTSNVFQVLHTTDSHGWLLGHQKSSFPEPNYSGDFGDFASFVKHMKEIALLRGVDLLLVDSGDLHDGTGLSDGGPVGSVDAHDSNKFFSELPYDLLAIGK